MIRERLRVAQSRQKSYADRRRRPLEFEVGGHVFLRVSPKKGLIRFSRGGGKLAPRYIGPFEVLERVERLFTALRSVASVPCRSTSRHSVGRR